MTIKRTLQETKNIIKEINLIYISEYRLNYIQRVIVKDESGYKYDLQVEHLKKKQFPDIVHKRNPFSLENIKTWLKNNNKNFYLEENNVYSGNKELLLFYCKKCQENFHMSWDNVFHHKGCSVCSGHQIGEKTSLAYMKPELIKEWICSDNNLTPYEVNIHSKENVLWKCSLCGNTEKQKVRDKLKSKGCKICSGLLLSDKNRLSILYPELLNEWDYENNIITPENVKYNSKDKFWWVCSVCNNKWNSSPRHRTHEKSGCPNCNFSKGEKKIESYLNILNISKITQYKFEDCRNILPLPFDFYLPDYNLCIEYHGEQHYKSKEFFGGNKSFKEQKRRDKIKEKYCVNNNIFLLIIPYWEFTNIELIINQYIQEGRIK